MAAARKLADGVDVLLINPSVRRRMAADPRITTTVHDVFTVWPDPKPDVIKVANCCAACISQMTCC